MIFLLLQSSIYVCHIKYQQVNQYVLLWRKRTEKYLSSVQKYLRSDSLWPHGQQHTRLPFPSPTPGICSKSCLSSCWCHPTISSSVISFSSCSLSFPAWGSFQMSQLFASGGQSIGAYAPALLMNIQDWFPLGLTGLISLKSKELSRVFLNSLKASVLQRSVFFMVQSMHDHWENHSFD